MSKYYQFCCPGKSVAEGLLEEENTATIAQGDFDVFLDLEIHHAEGIDNKTKNPIGEKRTYCVYGWVNPDTEFCTPKAEALPDPIWNRRFQIPLGRFANISKFLNLEIYRTNSKSDPCNSFGNVLIGKVSISLPKKIDVQKGGRFGLVAPMGLGSRADGHIIVAMELKMVIW